MIINQKKKREIWLEKNGSVSFLGLNISKKNGVPQVTVSKSFILKTLDMIETYNKKQDNNKVNKRSSYYVKILSRISYIKFNSHISYEKFKKKYKNRFNHDFIEGAL